MRYLMIGLLSAILGAFVYAKAYPQKSLDGAQPFVPTRIDWLTTMLQANLRTEALDTYGYQLQITSPDANTVLIYVRYLPTVNRQVMNMDIDAARKVIDIHVKSYHWQDWVKVREDIQMVTNNK